ncbi:MAG TPA: hypothetical protein VNQ77_17025 [Frankiaceae bacterium]|nr:hypothetical protein [Frankiaceae bacterium]
MTPDEFRERAATAVEPLQPSPASYEWLRANVARRRVRTRLVTAAAAAAVVGLAGAGYAALPHGDSAARPHTGATQLMTRDTGPTVSPSPERTMIGPKPYTRPTVAMDLDGDGKVDTARIVEEPGRWGVEVERTERGKATVWMPGLLGRYAHAIVASTNVDDDYRAEVVVDVSDDPALEELVVLIPVGMRDLVWLAEADGAVAILRQGTDGEVRHSYGCADERDAGLGRVVIRQTKHVRGDARHVYTVVNGRLRFVRDVPGTDLPLPESNCSV